MMAIYVFLGLEFCLTIVTFIFGAVTALHMSHYIALPPGCETAEAAGERLLSAVSSLVNLQLIIITETLLAFRALDELLNRTVGLFVNPSDVTV